jgi:hypothetical protein
MDIEINELLDFFFLLLFMLMYLTITNFMFKYGLISGWIFINKIYNNFI